MPDSAAASPTPDPTSPEITTVVFDLGAVVLSWAPERAYQQVMPADQVADFMTKIDFPQWNRTRDGGQSFDVGEQELLARFPESAVAIRAYRQHFVHTLTGMVDGTGAIVAELARAGLRLVALTNWSAETFPHAFDRFGLLKRFEGIVVSGTERLTKPDAAIFQLLAQRYQIDPGRAVFVDDVMANVAAATALGFTGIQFIDAAQLRDRLVTLGVLGAREPVPGPIFHITERVNWEAAQSSGDFVWSSRHLSYDQQGFVHCSFADQVEGVLANIYADLPPGDLVLLELDPARLDVPVIVEDLGAGAGYPHIYAPLPISGVTAVRALG
jgi:2-haloacid dehalogenase